MNILSSETENKHNCLQTLSVIITTLWTKIKNITTTHYYYDLKEE